MKYVLSMIDKLRDEWYNPPITYHQKRAEFEYDSYKRSAINEIKMYLMSNDSKNPIIAVEEFRHMMDVFACETKDGNSNFMFSVYYDVATDVLDLLCGMN